MKFNNIFFGSTSAEATLKYDLSGVKFYYQIHSEEFGNVLYVHSWTHETNNSNNKNLQSWVWVGTYSEISLWLQQK